jgi:F0F1-type ATP synthase delta subunit
MEQAYAQALWKIVERGTTPHKAVVQLQESLKASGRLALMPRIARAFGRIAEREAKSTDLVLTIASEAHESSAKRAAKEVLKEMEIDADLKTQVDDTLIGGWRLEGKGVLLDHSYKKQLLDIYQRSTK